MKKNDHCNIVEKVYFGRVVKIHIMHNSAKTPPRSSAHGVHGRVDVLPKYALNALVGSNIAASG